MSQSRGEVRGGAYGVRPSALTDPPALARRLRAIQPHRANTQNIFPEINQVVVRMFGWGWKGERGGDVTSCSAYLLDIPFRELSLDELANLIDQLSHVPQVAALVQGEPPPRAPVPTR